MGTIDYDAIAKYSQVVGFVLFAAATVWVWMKFLAPAIRSAQANTNRQIAEAERHRDEAKGALDALRREIEGAKHDASLIRARGEEQARREASAIVAEARESGERSLRNAQGELDRARAAAREAMRAEFAEKALRLALADAPSRIDAATNAELVERFSRSLERGGGN